MNTSNNQFGLMIAYLLPGFIGLAGIAPFMPVVASWLHPLSEAEASLGPPVYAVLAATTLGMVMSCFRWVLVDHVHQWTGIVRPAWDDTRLEDRLAAFNYLVESHYRYYQFVANALVAVVFAYVINRAMSTSPLLGAATDLAAVVLCVTLFVVSRDALSKYYSRTGRLFGTTADDRRRGEFMYNGNHNDGAAAKPDISQPPKDVKTKPLPNLEQDKAKAKPQK